MKRKLLITVSVILAVIIAVCVVNFTKFPISSAFTFTSHSSEPQKFIAHRGLSSAYPENTLPAIQGAIDAGFYGVEFDIHTTKDGVWLLNHDSDIDKMTNGTGEISELSFDEIQQFTVDNGNNIEDYENLKLPKLEDALKIIKDTSVVPFIEIKGYNKEAFINLLALIEEHGLTDSAVIISFDMEALLGIRELNKSIKLMFITNNLTKEDVDICIENGNIGVDINFGLISKITDAVKYAQQNNLEVATWTVDFPIAADAMNLFGIKYITTNRILP